ncbi:MAG: hypothetical protein ABUS47_05645 [Steroidobacter sp.]
MALFRRKSAASDTAIAHQPLDANQQQLLQLNIDFLKLLIAANQPDVQASVVTRSQLSLPSVQTTAMSECSDEAIRTMAACGFSLFSFSFHLADMWERMARSAVQESSVQRYAGDANAAGNSPIEVAYAGFAECALFFAWHLAQHQPMAARVMLGMREETAAILAPLQLWQCRQIAQRSYQMLTPRWPNNPYFWVDMLRYATTKDEEHFRFARLMGTQLIARDMEPSAFMRVSPVEGKATA